MGIMLIMPKGGLLSIRFVQYPTANAIAPLAVVHIILTRTVEGERGATHDLYNIERGYHEMRECLHYIWVQLRMV